METTRKLATSSLMGLITVFVIGALPALAADFDGSAYTFASATIISNVRLPSYYLGILISGYAAGIAVFSLVGGFLFDKFSPKTIVVASVLFFSVFTITTGYSVNAVELIISRVLVGFGVGMFQSASVAFLGDANPESRGTGVMVWGVMAGLGLVIAPYIFLPFHHSYRMPFLISGIIGFVISVIFYALIPNIFKMEKKPKNPLREMVNGYSIFPMLAMFFFGFTLLNVLGYFSYFLESVVGFTYGSTAVIISVLGVGGIVFGIPAGIASDRIGRKYILVLAITLIFLSSLLMVLLHRNILLYLILTIAFGTGWSIFSILSPAAGQDMVRDQVVGSVSGAVLMTFNIGGIIGPLLLSYLLTRIAFRTAFLYAAVIPALIALIITVAMRYPKNVKEIVNAQLKEELA
ncbi:MFS transporter [Thermoplasma sp.]|uniref:MFS transporter n=1 Tax=Thermoplasma sp. TaxID=1973142 RepID=UPI0026396637|nr:MFS transporter [Thermoplasma sp.]